jgi:hypothetical protein
MRNCWAAALGNCKGGITGEHIVSRSFFTTDVVEVAGAPWFKGSTKRIPLDAAVANVLCQYHNGTLGTYADTTAMELRAAIQEKVRNEPAATRSRVPYVRTPAGLLIEKPTVRLHGPSFGAWLCKTHCNVYAATGRAPAPAYVRYAFSRRNEGVRFYFPYAVGDGGTFREQPHATYMNFDEPGEPAEPFAIQVCGLATLVALQPPAKWGAAGRTYLDRVAELRLDTLTLQFDWSDDPPSTAP